eukprot:Phypoly_transcript_22038.p1 GENE.Phypoly_transcript_22038~~Phypoly_transcript_22038.p1  ORF type:complete len:143 (+),score=25.12 Phypoly_transcript_22038:133-561(+)
MLIEREMPSWTAKAKKGHFSVRHKQFIADLDIFEKVAKPMGISAKKMGFNNFEVSWNSDHLYDLTLEYCKSCVKETWLALLGSAENSAQLGYYNTTHKSYVFTSLPSFLCSLPSPPSVPFLLLPPSSVPFLLFPFHRSSFVS